MKKVIFIIILLLNVKNIQSQEWTNQDTITSESERQVNKFNFNGYVKNMQSLNFSKNLDNLLATNLLHNRLNFKWMPVDKLTLTVEIRNRLIWGDEVKIIPGYKEALRNSNETTDLSKIWFSNSSLVMHSNTDRLYVEYDFEKIGVRIGRQRINWGISTIWNPNDLFNTYNFLDFDYEERPGSDAIKLNVNISSFSGVEVAYSPGNRASEKVVAGKLFFNTGGYDIQLITGVFKNRFTAGLGWAGNIGNAGFKGETQFFSQTSSEKAQLNLSLESDYIFESGWYFNSSFLYNNRGIENKIQNLLQLDFNFSPSSLMPTKWNIAIGTGKEVSPLVSANISVLYAPGTNLLLLLPGIKYSIADNLTADLIWQSFFAKLAQFEALNHRGFLRLKYNF